MNKTAVQENIALLMDELKDYKEFLFNEVESQEDVINKIVYIYINLFGEFSTDEDYFDALVFIMENVFDEIEVETQGLYEKVKLFKMAIEINQEQEELEIEEESLTKQMNYEDSGYVYVLINPSMDGLVKIGKTTREPENRIEELSRATGVPTPFTLVYKEYFDYCSKAEYTIHNILDERGYRVSNNREFFSAPIYEVISLIQELKQNFPSHNGNNPILNERKVTSYIDQINELIEEAEDYINGYGEKLEDVNKGLQLLVKAGKMGSAKAYRMLGKIYCGDSKVPVNIEKAMNYFDEGCQLEGQESNFCFLDMERFYAGTDIYSISKFINENNAIKCWEMYLNRVQRNVHHVNDKDVIEIIDFLKDKYKNLDDIELHEVLNWFKYELHRGSDEQLENSIEELKETIECYSEDEAETEDGDYWVDYSTREMEKAKAVNKFIKDKLPIDLNKMKLEGNIRGLYDYDDRHIKFILEIEGGNLFCGDVIQIGGLEDGRLNFIHKGTIVKEIFCNEESIKMAESGDIVEIVCVGDYDTFNFNVSKKYVKKLGTE